MKTIYLLFVLLFSSTSFAQTFEADLQVRPRFEFRNGYKTLLPENADPASQTSQRTRLILGYGDESLKVKFSGQSISVWGDSPTMRLEDNNAFSLFEAYGQYQTSPNFLFRVGRQVLSYDNQRILGEVNWAQQGQSHDAALISWKPAANHRLDVAAAYNAEAETLIEAPYLVNSYQNLQMAWYHMDVNNVGFSFLLMNTGYEFDTVSQEREVDYIQTFGAFHNFVSGDFSGNVGAYGQAGSRNNRDVSAWYTGLNLNYKLSLAWKAGLGAEYFSGTDMDDTSGEIKSFTPLFGTNHGFNGHMDYFYVGNHQNSVGLLDIYGKFSYTTSKFDFSIMPHVFSSSANIVDAAGNEQDNYLGTEIDLAAGYKFRKDLQVNFGYSQMFGSESLEILKGGYKDATQNWAWVMLSFSPKLFSYTKPEVTAL
ncbi:alginate export family protein [Salinimicrobium sp. TH3]|uniref:alginate export family protein n=1 Tax=Salinimicrobium sp. TH3 TaxID=2997342 RepID=UPI002273B226|nr:alginate export family protein [Salinimicrobium sp. TH3]MCY2688728.1 alginate export family protein [Salinimicrobium sp. TH3]